MDTDPPSLNTESVGNHSLNLLPDTEASINRITTQTVAINTQSICKNCYRFPRVGSSYCSEKCGQDYQYSQLIKEKEAELKKKRLERYDRREAILWEKIFDEWKSGATFPIQDAQLLQSYTDTLLELKKLNEKMSEVKQKIEVFDRIVQSSLQVEPPQFTSSSVRASYLDCPNCGSCDFGTSYAQHVAQCYSKNDAITAYGSAPSPIEDLDNLVFCDYYDPKTTKYCKLLRTTCPYHSSFATFRRDKESENQPCGCPTEMSPIGRCTTAKRDCYKHYNWEINLKQSLLLQQIVYEKSLCFLKQELVDIKLLVVARRLKHLSISPTERPVPGPASLTLLSMEKKYSNSDDIPK